jgi:methionine--tRNA ligase beta chain
MATIKDFELLDLRIGRIADVTRVAGSDKLLYFSVDLGEQSPRHIVSGVANVYDPQSLLGRSVVVVANLEPKWIAGVLSQGMLLGIERDHAGLPLLIFPQPDIAPGSKLS